MGGIGIDRRPKAAGEQRPSMVQLMSDLFKQHPKLVMLVTPEGTRAKQEQWKTGFLPCSGNGWRADCTSLYGLRPEKMWGR